jgi:hypothetical protein
MLLTMLYHNTEFFLRYKNLKITVLGEKTRMTYNHIRSTWMVMLLANPSVHKAALCSGFKSSLPVAFLRKGKFLPALNQVQHHEDVPCTKHHAMKMYGGLEVQLHTLNLALGGELTSSQPSCFTSPRVGTPRTHCIRGWVDPRAGLDMVEKRKLSLPCQESNPSCPAHSLDSVLVLSII